MNLFAEIEKNIERAFRGWTERMFGPARADDLVLMHHAILAEVERKVEIIARGEKVFPYPRVIVTLAAAEPRRRDLLKAAFGERMQTDIHAALSAARCRIPQGFSVELRVVEEGLAPIEVECSMEPSPSAAGKDEADGPARLSVVKGKAEQAEYTLDKRRTNIGRLAELTDADHRVVRRNDIIFEEGADEVSATVSRKHAHITLEKGEHRLCDDGSEFGTRVFRDGRSIEVPKANRRGERLRPGDEIYLGRACLRFEQ
jgi:hypothetical protein